VVFGVMQAYIARPSHHLNKMEAAICSTAFKEKARKR